MKINCNSNLFINALNIVSNGTTRTTMPILEGVLIECYNNKVTLTTYDLEIAITTFFECDIEREGTVVVEYKMISEIMRKLPLEDINIEVNANDFIIKSKAAIFNLPIMNEKEYPKLPVFDITSTASIKENILKNMIKKVLFAVSLDETRPLYTGALLKIEDNILNLVGLDGFRLALNKEIIENRKNDFKAIIPGKVLAELLKVLTDEENVLEIGTNKNQALFKIKNTTIISRIIEGEFLNYNTIIPKNNETFVTVKNKTLLDALERVALFSKDMVEKEKKYPVKFKISVDGIKLTCNSKTGTGSEKIESKVEGKEIEIGFNPRYLIETLKVIEDETIKISLSSNVAPAVIESNSDNKYLYIVLPIKIR